jgi:hypothetical protein
MKKLIIKYFEIRLFLLYAVNNENIHAMVAFFAGRGVPVREISLALSVLIRFIRPIRVPCIAHG